MGEIQEEGGAEIEYSLATHPQLEREWKRIDRKWRTIIGAFIEDRILSDPVANSKPLTGTLRGWRRSRVSDYRIVFSVSGRTVYILAVSRRDEVYPIAERRN